jgi:translation elongation factor P/translation initiation factor 5A
MATANSGSVGRGKAFVRMVLRRVNDSQEPKQVFLASITVSQPTDSSVAA